MNRLFSAVIKDKLRKISVDQLPERTTTNNYTDLPDFPLASSFWPGDARWAKRSLFVLQLARRAGRQRIQRNSQGSNLWALEHGP
jgi:hypothetical protein